jgi:hypothetical protein
MLDNLSYLLTPLLIWTINFMVTNINFIYSNFFFWSFIIPQILTKTKKKNQKSNKYMVPKFNVNMKYLIKFRVI